MAELIWTQQQFEELSWHDNYVHALRIEAGMHGTTGELILDLDYIQEWICEAEKYKFQIIPATLTFLEVINLRISLDYATPTAALGPFSINEIKREDEPRERYVAQIWKILINWPNGEITFEANGFVQRGYGTPILSDNQWLLPKERGQHN